MKQHQVLAIEAGAKKEAERALTELYKLVQKPDLFVGLTRAYEPKDEEGDRLPGEKKVVQVKLKDKIERVTAAQAKYLDLAASKDWTNCEARADVEVDGKVFISAAPVTYLMWLDKRLEDLHTFVNALPTLDPAEEWHYDTNKGCYATEPSEKIRTKKVPRAFEKSPATKEHPAQVETYYEDVQVGTWTEVKLSGALPADLVEEMRQRVLKLRQAVKAARERANDAEVQEQSIAADLLDFVFSGVK